MKGHNLIWVALASVVLCFCGPSERADLVLYNGKVVTVDQDFSIAEAVAVKDGLILATGILCGRLADGESIPI